MAEDEKKAAAEQALREKHEARVIQVQQELQEAVKKCETLEQSLTEKESVLTKALQAAHDARSEAQGALQEIQEAERSRRVRLCLCKANMEREEITFTNANSDFSRGVCGTAAQRI